MEICKVQFKKCLFIMYICIYTFKRRSTKGKKEGYAQVLKHQDSGSLDLKQKHDYILVWRSSPCFVIKTFLFGLRQ